jgi:hypothetical protein
MILVHKQTSSFSDRWSEWCKHKALEFITVDCFDSGIISRINKGDVLLWHWNQTYATPMALPGALFLHWKLRCSPFPNLNIC